MRLNSGFPLRATLLLCASIPLGSAAMAEAPPMLLPPSGFEANYDMFTLEFESLGADDGIAVEPEEPDYGCGEGDCGEYEEDYDDTPERTEREDTPSVTPGRTTALTNRIEGISAYCTDDYPREKNLNWPSYRIDCLRWELQRIAQEIPGTGDYAEMRTAVSIAASELGAIVQQNADPAAPTVDHVGLSTTGKARRSARRHKAIAPAQQARANAQAAAVLDKLSTQLLRSASSSASKRVHYERAAQAINSTKVLLRST